MRQEDKGRMYQTGLEVVWIDERGCAALRGEA